MTTDSDFLYLKKEIKEQVFSEDMINKGLGEMIECKSDCMRFATLVYRVEDMSSIKEVLVEVGRELGFNIVFDKLSKNDIAFGERESMKFNEPLNKKKLIIYKVYPLKELK